MACPKLLIVVIWPLETENETQKPAVGIESYLIWQENVIGVHVRYFIGLLYMVSEERISRDDLGWNGAGVVGIGSLSGGVYLPFCGKNLILKGTYMKIYQTKAMLFKINTFEELLRSTCLSSHGSITFEKDLF